ncbi:MAG: ComEA family DNA-binding protein [bacterium]
MRKLKPGQRPVYRVDVNAADVRELELLPGIGPAKASRIVEYRRAHGPFDSLDDLRRVPGVGPSIVRDINGLATAERAASEGDDTR